MLGGAHIRGDIVYIMYNISPMLTWSYGRAPSQFRIAWPDAEAACRMLFVLSQVGRTSNFQVFDRVQAQLSCFTSLAHPAPCRDSSQTGSASTPSRSPHCGRAAKLSEPELHKRLELLLLFRQKQSQQTSSGRSQTKSLTRLSRLARSSCITFEA